jgi:AcrR family transcriptional regulator
LTTVASSCERKEPITATDVTFQTSGSSRSASSGTLDKGCDDLVGGADAGQTRKDFFERKTVLFGVLACASVFHKHKSKAEASALARGGFDACVRGDTGEDNGVDAAGLELLLQVGASEGAPVALGDENISRLETCRGSDLRCNCGYWLVAHVVRLVDGLLHEVVDIDADIDNRSSGGTESFGKLFGVCNDLRGGIRGRVHADDGILQINEDECGLLMVKLKFWHGLLYWGSSFNKTEGILDSLDVEYEGALGFVKSCTCRSTAGALGTPSRGLSGWAAELFAEVGYEAATMTVIAERSGSSIGALYNYFPDKQAIALTLLNQYGEEIEAHWKPLMEQAPKLTHQEFANLFIERITELVRKRPAYLSLLVAPVRLRRPPAAKKALWATIANAFRAKNPSLSDEQSVLATKVTIQMVRGLMTLYAEAEPEGKDLVVDEFKKVLTSYLGTIMYQGKARAK